MRTTQAQGIPTQQAQHDRKDAENREVDQGQHQKGDNLTNGCKQSINQPVGAAHPVRTGQTSGK